MSSIVGQVWSRQGPGQVILDCFIFGDELDVLELRLRLLEDVVDTFVLVEATNTLSGGEKPLVFAANRDRFDRWRDRIIHVELGALPEPGPTRKRGLAYQRNSILQGVARAGMGRPDDVIVVGDVDEIVYSDALRRAAGLLRDGTPSVAFDLSTSRFYGNWIDDAYRCRVTKAHRRDALTNPHHQRRQEKAAVTIENAGRHISTLLAPAEIRTKLAAISDPELDNERDRDLQHLERCHEYGVALDTRRLLRRLPDDEWDEILHALYAMRPDLLHEGPMPPITRRRRYLAVTRARHHLPIGGAELAFLDRHTWSAAAGLLAWLVTAAAYVGRRAAAARARLRRSRPATEFPSAPCSVSEPCWRCLFEPGPPDVGQNV
ncbi:MAG TPA: hypothetical protein VGH52_00985 [Gaiellaceae bacterium]